MIFLFKFLGSAIFWIVYVGLSFFISTILFKYLAPKFMRRLKHNNKYGLLDEKMKEFKEEYSKLDHADFTTSMALGTKGGDFSKAIEREIEMLYEKGRENRRK